MEKQIIESLKSIVGSEYVTDSEVDLEIYACSAVPLPFIRRKADVIVLPGSVEEVSKVLAFANKNKIPVTTKGAGENFQAPSIPLHAGILLSLARMDRILEIDEGNMVATVEGGCSTYALYHQLERKGFRYPGMAMYTSGPMAGSAVAGNAQGCNMIRYGACGDQIMGLEVVLADGEVITFGTGAVSDYGYFYKYTGAPNPIGLFTQSLGTLGVVTKVTFRIVPKPQFEGYLTFAWSSNGLREASKALYELAQFGVYNIDVWNNWSFWSAIKSGKLPAFPPETEILGLISVDGDSEAELKLKEERVKEICGDYSGIDWGEKICKLIFGPPDYLMWEISAINYNTRRLIKSAALFSFYFVPILKFAEDYELFREIMEKYEFWNEKNLPRYRGWAIVPAAFSAYPGFYCRGEEEKGWEALQEWEEELLKRGAVPYSVGPTWPKSALERLGPQFELMKKIRVILDPNNILNPGHLFHTQER